MTGGADFWSRRKARVEAEAEAEALAARAAEEAAREAAQAGKTDEEICADLGLPDPDTLGPGDDFRAFMARAVPERLRRRALRRLWLSNPALANLDGMIDYGEDFTDSACVIENLRTAYQVGKGMLAHVEETARQAEAEAGPDTAAEPPADRSDVLAVAESETGDEAGAEAAQPAREPSAEEKTTEAGEAPPPPRRRMRFAFDDSAGVTA
ncbi:MAG: hypothetical protein CMN17_08855 [Roseovarius sp.]|nr:hypothetical protein [Roseovarius sp.]MBK45777.1 hypothetical protein [Roseovarius sp.]